MEESFDIPPYPASSSDGPEPSEHKPSAGAAMHCLKAALGLVLVGVLSWGGFIAGGLIGAGIGRAYGSTDRWDDITGGCIGMPLGGIVGLALGMVALRSLLRDD